MIHNFIIIIYISASRRSLNDYRRFQKCFFFEKTNLNGKLEKAKKNELIEMLSFVLLKSVPRFSHSVLIHFHYFVVKFNIVRSELATINLCP